MWSFDEVDNTTTLQNLIDKYSDSRLLHEKIGEISLELEYISYGNKLIYNSFMPSMEECKDNKKLIDIIKLYNENLDSIEELSVSLGIDIDSDDEEQNEHYKKLKEIEIEPITIRLIV